MTIFIVAAVVGIVLMLFGIIFDGLFDSVDDTVVPAAGVALMIFGASGLISNSLFDSSSNPADVYKKAFFLSFIISLVCTIIFVVLWKIIKRKNSSENIEEIELNSIIGTLGNVIRWGENGGEAIFSYLGSNAKINIITEDNKPLAFGDVVVAIEQVDDEFLVEKIDSLQIGEEDSVSYVQVKKNHNLEDNNSLNVENFKNEEK